MVSFTIDSTIDGAVHIFGPNRSIFTRIFWFFLFILSIFGLFYYIRNSYKKWLLEPDIITKTRLRRVEELPRYAVTVCPHALDANLFNLTAMDENFRDNKNISQEECDEVRVYKKWCNVLEPERMPYSFGVYYGANDIETCSDQLGPIEQTKVPFVPQRHETTDWSKIAQILLKSQENFIKTSARYQTFKHYTYRSVLTLYGACTTFRAFSKSIFQEKWMDDAQGLMKDGEVESDWSLDDWTKNSGSHFPYTDKVILLKLNNSGFNFCKREANTSFIKVIIHQPDQLPTYAHDTIDYIDVNGSTFAFAIKTKSQRSNDNLRVLDPHVRKCYFEDERKLKYFKRYTQQYCIVECMFRTSGCDPLEIPKAKGANGTYCHARWETVKYLESNYNKNDECKCYPNCNYLQFKIKYKDDVKRFGVSKTATHLRFEYDDGGEDFSSSFIEETEKFLSYTITSFVADIGGYLGLFLGCSLLSIVEIFFFIACKIFNLTRKYRNNQQQDEIHQIEDSKSVKEEVEDIKRNLSTMQQKLDQVDLSELKENLENIHQMLKIDNKILRNEIKNIWKAIESQKCAEEEKEQNGNETPGTVLDLKLLEKIAEEIE